MNRILLADDSPHAQRMGERILRDEGYEVVSVTDGETALLRLADVDPDVIIADAFLPGRSGLEICHFVKEHPKHRHVRIVLTAGMLETFDEAEARAAGTDAIVKKPFEASVLLEILRPLVDAAQTDRSRSEPPLPAPPLPQAVFIETPPQPAPAAAPAETPAPMAKPGRKPAIPEPPPPRASEPEPERNLESEPEAGPVTAGAGVSEEELLRAAVTLALDAAFPALVDDITAKVLRNLRSVGGPSAAELETPTDIPVPVASLPSDNE
jgi:CheY-like chemotaxis protein